MKWYNTNYRAYLLDLQMPDDSDQMPIGQPRNLRDLDPEKVVDALHRSGVQALYMHAKDNQGNAYYNTRYGHKHTGIGDRDVIAEMSAACRKRGMTFLVYVQLTREQRGSLEWPGIGFEGKPVDRNRLNPQNPLSPSDESFPSMCLNGGGREYIKNIVTELAAGYDIDGYWLDNPNNWVTTAVPCYCRTCTEKYFQESGRSIPSPGDREANNAAWRDYLAYRIRLNSIVMKDIISSIRETNPDLTVTHNGTNYTFSMGEDFCDWDDFVTHEFHYSDGYGNLGLTCRKNESVKPNHRFEVEVWRFFNLVHHPGTGEAMPRGYQIRSVSHLLADMSTILANGGFLQYYDQLRPDGTLDELSLKQMSAAFEMIKPLEQFFFPDQERAGYAAIVWSKSTESFAITPQKAAHSAGLEGFHYALTESMMPHRFIMERDVAAEDFGNAKVLVLPSVACMTDKVADGIRDFVRNGGGLVATSRTSLLDGRGNPRENFLLSDVFGADYLEPVSFTFSSLEFDSEHALQSEIPLNWPMTLWQLIQLKVEPHDGSEPVGRIVHPMRGFPMGHPPGERTRFPGAVVSSYGKGRVVYLPQPAGHAYQKYGHFHTSQLIVNAVRLAAGEDPPVQGFGSDTCELVMQLHGGKRYVHLVNRTAAGSVRATASTWKRTIPAQGLSVRFAEPTGRVVQHPDGVELKIRNDGNSWMVDLETVQEYAILEVE